MPCSSTRDPFYEFTFRPKSFQKRCFPSDLEHMSTQISRYICTYIQMYASTMDDSLCILRPFKVIIQNLKLTQFVDCPEIKNCRMLRFLFERVQIKDQNSTVLIDTRMAFYNTRSEGA
jgi:hypothetical protein